ncbi:ThiF family adenylyltransferase [Agromyces salentinus]|uniref:ThiF family adenylyltransferase n=1 Tax=Agromyces salentinus TaxID=269421 RepID=A0ABN2MLM1_9MICO|nr:ThiF family adenylyltransferase [Agromyces salentinus]
MSRQLLSRSDDLRRLVDGGFEIQFVSNMLTIGVPYVNTVGQVARGRLITTLESAGDRTANPVGDHTVFFVGATNAPGDLPCDSSGQPLAALMHQQSAVELGSDLVASCGFSHKPPAGYADYYEKLTTYATILLTEVHRLDPNVRVETFAPMASEGDESVHRYFDSATSRARIGAATDKTRNQRIAIIGLGGTGSYILDAVIKTHVAEIHLFDGDRFHPHNAFRAPGATPLEQLLEAPSKVSHHHRTTSALHKHVIPHPENITPDNVALLQEFDFVFIAIDSGPHKRVIIDHLIAFGVSFVDTGMGVDQVGSSLGGLIRTTRINLALDSMEWVDANLSFAEGDDIYEQNIQVVELNMLGAAHAVIAWKKALGFYRDYGDEVSSTYTLDGNRLMNEARVDAH